MLVTKALPHDVVFVAFVPLPVPVGLSVRASPTGVARLRFQLATPTGSTAYNKSVNGAVVDPLLPCLQVTELASVNSNKFRTLGSSFILSGKRELTLKLRQDGNDFPTMGMDNESLSIQHVESVRIQLSEKVVKTVKLKNNSFWEKVKRTYL